MENESFEIKTQVSPKYLYYYSTMVYLAFLIMVSVIFAMIVRSNQIVPMALIGVFFIISVVINLIHFNRQIYFSITGGRKFHGASYFVEIVVPLKLVSNVRRVWGNTYMLKVNGTKYFFISFKKNVEYLKAMIEQEHRGTNESQSEG